MNFFIIDCFVVSKFIRDDLEDFLKGCVIRRREEIKIKGFLFEFLYINFGFLS